MAKVENCDARNKHNVGPGDVSEYLGAYPDNDWYCPIAGLHVILVKEGGEYFCVLPSGVGCGKWNEDADDQDRFDKYVRP